ncbi:MAG: TonB-dependent siderophore receptor [Opitutaceae bacterium]
MKTLAPSAPNPPFPSRRVKQASSTLTAVIVASGSPLVALAAESPSKEADLAVLPSIEVQSQRNREVSSPKFTAPLVDTPQTISVIPQEVFSQQGAASLADVLSNTPGITFLAGEGGHVSGSNSIVMRGFDATGSIFIDGVRDNGNYGRDVYNLEQVEVVKGPAGDNGRGTASGYINLSTKSPRASDFAASTLSYGFDGYASVDRQRATLDVNRSLDETVKGAAFRVTALWQDSGVAGRDYAEKKSWGVAPSLALGLGTPTRLTLGFQHDEQNDRPDFGTLGGTVAGTATAIRPRLPVERSRFYGHTSDFDDVKLNVLSARLEHDLSPSIRLSNVTRASSTDREAIYTVLSAINNLPDRNSGQALEIVTANRQAFFREVKTFSNQSNLASQFATGSLLHAFAGGLEFIREQGHALRDWTGLGVAADLSKDVNQTAAGAPAPVSTVVGTSPYQPNPHRPITGFAPVYAFVDDIRIDTFALYAYDTIKLNERWQATGGARLEHYKANYDILARATNLSTPFEVSDTLLTGKLGLVFKPARNGSLYFSWGVAAQPPGTSNLSNDNGSRSNGTPGTTGQNSPNADPQKSSNYELGTKWDFFQRKLTTSFAFFRSERTHIATATDAGTGEPSAYGDQQVQGIELGVSGRITNHWILFGGWSYLDSENRNPSNAVADGAELNWTPSYSGNLWTTYRLPFRLTLGGGLQYTGESKVALSNTNAAALPAHTVFNAMASYEITPRLNLRLNVNNVADKLYARSLNNNSNRTYLGEPRSFLASLEFKF